MILACHQFTGRVHRELAAADVNRLHPRMKSRLGVPQGSRRQLEQNRDRDRKITRRFIIKSYFNMA